jgi:polyhydroxyalkanoate synthesis regulator protein
LRRIIKHANRRLYDAKAGRVITLLELSDLVLAGEDISVRDKSTDEDITAVALLQSVLERLRRRRDSAMEAAEAERLVAAVTAAMNLDASVRKPGDSDFEDDKAGAAA